MATRKAFLDALTEIATKTAGDTVIWATINRKTGKVTYWYAPAQCEKTEETKEDFLAQFKDREIPEAILRFVEQGYIDIN